MNSAGFNLRLPMNPAESLCRRWREIIDLYLPVFEKNSFWRYSRLREANDSEQGWKLHVSATILNAVEILETVAPFLKKRNVFYKTPDSLLELKKLNAGIFYDYSQIGKFITIYPQNDRQAVSLANKIHQLTRNFSAPAVPFETRFKPGSCVYYRYGAFKVNWFKNADGDEVLAVRDERGELIPDLRDTNAPQKIWTANPFSNEKKAAQISESPLKTRFRIFRALSQRGKGGVYQGFDVSGESPRLCLLKEGRKDGENEWSGRDGFWRVKHETAVLEILHSAKINVPEIYSTFEAENNFYLAAEFIEGKNLHVYLKKRKRRLNILKAIDLAIQLAEIIKQIHAAGWLWRDCKPANLIATKQGKLRPLDFEGACLINEPDFTAWSTLKPKSKNHEEEVINQTSAVVDLYALGAIIYLLFEGELPNDERHIVNRVKRKSVPPKVKSLISKLLNPPTAKKLTAAIIEQKLKAVQRKLIAAHR